MLDPSDSAVLKHKTPQKGMVYLSRIPPFMGPGTIRQMLSEFGKIERIFLTPEDASVSRKRKRSQGAKPSKSRRRFIDGWVEFGDKRIAKAVARDLNATPMGGSKRSKFYSDLWCIKYLKGFKWNQLTEQIAFEKAVRDQKMQTELMLAKKEHDFIVEKVAQAKAISHMEERKSNVKEEKEGNTLSDDDGNNNKRKKKIKRNIRTFRQVPLQNQGRKAPDFDFNLVKQMLSGKS